MAVSSCLECYGQAPEVDLSDLNLNIFKGNIRVYHGHIVYFFAGGIPYEGWSEGNVVARVTHGYKLPKPDHVDDKL